MYSFVDAFRDGKTAEQVVKYIKQASGDRRFRIVHVCGTHEDAIMKNGIRNMLPRNVEVLMGPGCPVCTVPPNRIDYTIRLAEEGAIVTTFGDMMRVPAGLGSLADAKARGHDIRMVYSIHDAVKIAQENPDREVVHFAVGFETTAPTTASEILAGPPENFSVYSAHLLIPPAMEALLEMGVSQIDGFIDPGHVSTIIGEVGYQTVHDKYPVPQVIAGFEPLDILFSIALIIKQKNEGRAEIENTYQRAVKPEGLPKALEMLDKVFEPEDAPWRGIGTIPKSGLQLRPEYKQYDASKKFDILVESDYSMPPGCKCGEVLRAMIYPWDCPLFNKICNPDNPVGPCMVSHEGSCYIAARYGVDEL
ncbi:MAG: hydrogenase formation protein HypD [Candidatus Bathyarchaeota archaeon]|nr:hydrogenase formation protein HypD [Candidatus Bathyarchaeota archaeon]